MNIRSFEEKLINNVNDELITNLVVLLFRNKILDNYETKLRYVLFDEIIFEINDTLDKIENLMRYNINGYN
jgi:hypothetical protein